MKPIQMMRNLELYLLAHKAWENFDGARADMYQVEKEDVIKMIKIAASAPRIRLTDQDIDVVVDYIVNRRTDALWMHPVFRRPLQAIRKEVAFINTTLTEVNELVDDPKFDI